LASSILDDKVKLGKHVFGAEDHDANITSNPVLRVQEEAVSLWCPEGGDLKPFVRCFVSIGVGFKIEIRSHGGNTEESSYNYATQAKTIRDNQSIADRFSKRWVSNDDVEKTYFRFDVDGDFGHLRLDEWRSMFDVRMATEKYLTRPERQSQLQACVRKLQLDQDTPILSSQTMEKISHDLASKRVSDFPFLSTDTKTVKGQKLSSKEVKDDLDDEWTQL
jgi:hypothetical protein